MKTETPNTKTRKPSYSWTGEKTNLHVKAMDMAIQLKMCERRDLEPSKFNVHLEAAKILVFLKKGEK